jgi:hypothetical protein
LGDALGEVCLDLENYLMNSEINLGTLRNDILIIITISLGTLINVMLITVKKNVMLIIIVLGTLMNVILIITTTYVIYLWLCY